MKTVVFLLHLVLVLANQSNLEKFASSNRQLSAAIYNELTNTNTNICISPFSIETILIFAQSGAKDTTASEIRKSLLLPNTTQETESIIKTVLASIHNDQYVLQTANKIYVEEHYSITEEFQKTATNIYQTEIENIDFSQNIEVPNIINQWVEEHTNNKIHDIISSRDINKNTRLLLINTLYFQGNWSKSFNPADTKKTNFYTDSKNVVNVETMFQNSEQYNYAEISELSAQILELPFKGEDASMVIVLPNENDGIKTLEDKIKKGLITPSYSVEQVQVSIPKFKIEETVDFEPVLKKIGIEKAFNPTEADFSEIAGEPHDLYIGKIAQKTYIDVTEGGIEAAAASSIVIPVNPLPPSTPTKYFIADHPFLFYIIVKDIILFEGRVFLPQV